MLAGAVATAQAAIKEEPVTYKAGDTTLKGYVVYDDATGAKRPGIIVVHEWWGITPHVRGEARKLAEQGYIAFVADMYGDAKTADNPTDAEKLMMSVLGKPDVMQSRFNAAKDALARHPTVNASRIGAEGFCFGGGVVLDMARTGANLAAVSAFHAGLDSVVGKPAPGKVKAKILVQNGADDPFVKPEEVTAFKSEMDAAKADYRYISYPGAVHAFTNPDATKLGKQFNLPLAYNAKVDQESKAESSKFFAQTLKQ
jgi:dienelactone hydrolase